MWSHVGCSQLGKHCLHPRFDWWWWQLMMVRFWVSGCVDLFGCVLDWNLVFLIWFRRVHIWLYSVISSHICICSWSWRIVVSTWTTYVVYRQGNVMRGVWLFIPHLGSVLGSLLIHQSGKWSYGLVSFLRLSVMKKLTCVGRGHVGACTRHGHVCWGIAVCGSAHSGDHSLVTTVQAWTLVALDGGIRSGEFLDCVMSNRFALIVCWTDILLFLFDLRCQRRLAFAVCQRTYCYCCVVDWTVLFCILAVQMMSGEPYWFVYTSHCSK